jgi:hypothetical protein
LYAGQFLTRYTPFDSPVLRSSLRIFPPKRRESTQADTKLTALLSRLLRVNVNPTRGRRIYATTPAGGAEAILRLNDVGRRSVLVVRAISQLTIAIKHSPRLHGFEMDLWEREQLLAYIKREFGITYSRSHLYRIVRDLGLSHRLAATPRRSVPIGIRL